MKRIIRHIIFWVVILLFQVTRSRSGDLVYSFHEIYPIFFEHFTMLPILIVASYFTADFIFPRYFYTKKYFQFILILALSCAFFVLVMRAYLYYIFFPEFYMDLNIKHPHFLNFNVSQHIFYIYSTVAIVVMMKYVRRVNKIEEQKSVLEKQSLTSELALLRAQVSPHFLFNTLNNINALVKKDAQKTYESIIKLSEIMRYMLHEVKNDEVLLTKEIEYLKSFIGLLLLRVEDQNFIQFNVKGEVEGVKIAPMLFVPLVENAFKHGNKDVDSPGIVINLIIKDHTVLFDVTNFLKQNREVVDSTSGIGLSNLKRRLDLLYPKRHNFQINIDENKHIASLSINYK